MATTAVSLSRSKLLVLESTGTYHGGGYLEKVLDITHHCQISSGFICSLEVKDLVLAKPVKGLPSGTRLASNLGS